MKNTVRRITIAATDAVFDARFRAETIYADLPDAAAEAAYERRDELLTQAISAVAQRLFPTEFTKQHLHVRDDWWPNHTRYVDASIDAFTQRLFDETHALLVGAYAQWRIQVVVYSDIFKGRTMIGSVVIGEERLLVDQALYDFLIKRGFDFRCLDEPELLDTVD